MKGLRQSYDMSTARIFQSRFSVGILIRNCVDFDQFTNCCTARGALSEFDRILPKIMHRTVGYVLL